MSYRLLRALLWISALASMVACTPVVKVQQTPPPVIACAEHVPGLQVSAVPASDDDMKVWANQALGVIQDDRTKRQTTARCLDQYRKDGVIR